MNQGFVPSVSVNRKGDPRQNIPDVSLAPLLSSRSSRIPAAPPPSMNGMGSSTQLPHTSDLIFFYYPWPHSQLGCDCLGVSLPLKVYVGTHSLIIQTHTHLRLKQMNKHECPQFILHIHKYMPTYINI